MAKNFANLFREAERSPDYQLEHVRMAFVGEVTRLMDAQGLSRAELARRLGVSRAYITKLLNGNANITLDTMVRVAMALNARVNLAMAEEHRRLHWFSCMDGGGGRRLHRRERSPGWGDSRFRREEGMRASVAT